MDKETARRILSAYRPNGADADDETFADALRLARNDPETARWFEDETTFDQQIASALETITVPPQDHRTLDSMLTLETGEDRPRSWWRRGLAMAAILTFGLALYGILVIQPDSAGVSPDPGQTLTSFADRALPLDFRSTNHAEVRGWLARAGVPIPADIEVRFADTPTLGCKVFDLSEGGSITVLCFESNGQIAHLLTLRGRADSLAEDIPDDWTTVDGWNLRRIPSDGLPMILATQSDPSKIETESTLGKLILSQITPSPADFRSKRRIAG